MPQGVRWTALDLASPGERTAAWLIDAALFWALFAGGLIWLVETGELGASPRLIAPRVLVWLVVIWTVSRLYDAACISTWGSTAGRRILGIEVRAPSGVLPGRTQALLRSCLQTPAVLLAGAGVIGVWSDPQRRALHDRVADTRVVRSEALEPAGDAAGGLAGDDELVDADEAAIRAAHLRPQQAGWLRAVAQQTATRLDVAAPSWRRGEDPATIRSRAFCLLLARLAARYPQQRDAITCVLDGHRALDRLESDRVGALSRLLSQPDAARRWIGLPDSANVGVLLDHPVAT